MKSTRNPNPPPPPELGSQRALKEVKKSSQLQIRIEPEFEARLTEGAMLCKMSKSAFVLAAIEEKLAMINKDSALINTFEKSLAKGPKKQRKTIVMVRKKTDYISGD